jgi:hypothetical protein
MNNENYNQNYYFKNTNEKLILVSEEVLIEMIRSKSLDPNTKVFSKEFNVWMRASELTVYVTKPCSKKIDKLPEEKILQDDDVYRNKNIILIKEKDAIQNIFEELLIKYEASLKNENSIRLDQIEKNEKLEDLDRRFTEVENDLFEQSSINDKISSVNKDLITELNKYKEQVNKLETLVGELKEVPSLPPNDDNLKIEKLNIDNSKKDIQIKELQIIASKKEKLQKNLKSKIELINELNKKIIEQQKQSVSVKKYKEVINKLKYFEKSYDLLFEKTKTIAQKWNSGQKEILKLQKLLGISQKAQPEIQKGSAVKNMKISKHIENIEKVALNNPLVEKENVGEMFRLNSDKIWKINLAQYKNNLFNIFELKKLISDNKLVKETKVKMLGKVWSSISKTFELNTEILVKLINGQDTYFIQRESIRVPVQQLVQINQGENQFDCLCVNVSRGGCFLEMKSLPSSIKIEDNISVKFILQNNKEMITKCIVKSMKDTLNTASIGLMFENPCLEFKQWIESEVHEFSSQYGLEVAA